MSNIIQIVYKLKKSIEYRTKRRDKKMQLNNKLNNNRFDLVEVILLLICRIQLTCLNGTWCILWTITYFMDLFDLDFYIFQFMNLIFTGVLRTKYLISHSQWTNEGKREWGNVKTHFWVLILYFSLKRKIIYKSITTIRLMRE